MPQLGVEDPVDQPPVHEQRTAHAGARGEVHRVVPPLDSSPVVLAHKRRTDVCLEHDIGPCRCLLQAGHDIDPGPAELGCLEQEPVIGRCRVQPKGPEARKPDTLDGMGGKESLQLGKGTLRATVFCLQPGPQTVWCPHGGPNPGPAQLDCSQHGPLLLRDDATPNLYDLPMLLLLVWSALAMATPSLTDVRVFAGGGHTRMLLVFDGAFGAVATRSEAGADGATVLLRVESARRGGALVLSADPAHSGLSALEATDVPGDALEVLVRLPQARVVRTTPLTEEALLVDLLEEGRGDDAALPSPVQLRAWLEGTTLPAPTPLRPSERRLVVLDAGHGGWDHGAVGTTGTREADLALQIALRARRVLETRYGYEVFLTRDEDVFVGLTERASLANEREADLFVSIHANAAPAPTAWGIETYSLDTASDAGAARVARRENAVIREQRTEEGRGDPLLARMLVAGNNALSRRLSAQVQQAAIDRLQDSYGTEQIRDLGSKTALFTVLTTTRMPAVLFEAGFVSNPDDERRLRTPHYQQEIAEAIGDAVEQWFASADARARDAAP